jgi:hypothetical protein
MRVPVNYATLGATYGNRTGHKGPWLRWSQCGSSLPGDLLRCEHRAVGADAEKAAFALGDGAAEAGADAAGHGGFERELGRDAARLRDGGDGF